MHSRSVSLAVSGRVEELDERVRVDRGPDSGQPSPSVALRKEPGLATVLAPPPILAPGKRIFDGSV